MKNNFIIIFFILLILISISLFFVFIQRKNIYLKSEMIISENEEESREILVDLSEDELDKNYLKDIRAIYMTSWSASRKDFTDNIINIIKNTKINSVVIDIKDWTGCVVYDSVIPEVEEYKAKSIRIRNIDSFIKKLKEHNVYLIARISVFQDPVLATARPDLAIHTISNPDSLWLDKSGLAWIDPSTKESWDYNINIAKEVISLGFDEINFDYIRFPSDGNLGDMMFPVWDKTIPRHLIIKEFFQYLRQEMPNAKLSADLFVCLL